MEDEDETADVLIELPRSPPGAAQNGAAGAPDDDVFLFDNNIPSIATRIPATAEPADTLALRRRNRLLRLVSVSRLTYGDGGLQRSVSDQLHDRRPRADEWLNESVTGRYGKHLSPPTANHEAEDAGGLQRSVSVQLHGRRPRADETGRYGKHLLPPTANHEAEDAGGLQRSVSVQLHDRRPGGDPGGEEPLDEGLPGIGNLPQHPTPSAEVQEAGGQRARGRGAQRPTNDVRSDALSRGRSVDACCSGGTDATTTKQRRGVTAAIMSTVYDDPDERDDVDDDDDDEAALASHVCNGLDDQQPKNTCCTSHL